MNRSFAHHQSIGFLTILLIGILSITASPLWGQKAYRVVSSGNHVLIQGSSNLHEWESKTEQVSGELVVTEGSLPNTLTQFNKVSLRINVASITGGKSMMDSRMMDALKGVRFPVISFQSSVLNIPRANDVTAMGQLTIAGVTLGKTISATYTVLSDRIQIKGTARVKMSDFGIAAPTAMLGTLKTKDEVVLVFDVTFQR